MDRETERYKVTGEVTDRKVKRERQTGAERKR